MTETLDLGLTVGEAAANLDNLSDWALEQFQAKYGAEITKDDIWEYLYGVMHSPHWRIDYRHDLQRNLPRIPLADDFEAFRSAGRKLMDLHIDYETVDEYPVQCLVDGEPDEGDADGNAYRIESRMRWGKGPDGSEDRTVLLLNRRCRLVGIPVETTRYTVSGRTPLQWAIDSLRVKHDKASGIIDDPNGWRDWADEPFNLIRHLRRLVTVSYESAHIIAWLPTSRPGESHLYEPGPVTLADIIESAATAEPSEDSTGIVYTDEEFEAHLDSLPYEQSTDS
ncbi:type ISP restriction/modification enzyme [Candidatus Poriferisodalis sp.]|uniref:type ISP restriction/modification enzyme n=1 Tax=Candidatus Poriferisodalis sp. TaxID=3101277 RepID=UPI003B013B66